MKKLTSKKEFDKMISGRLFLFPANIERAIYNIDQKPEPFIETGAYTAYKKIPLGIKGVYIFYDFITGRALYVGKAKDLRKRLYSYTKASYGTACEKFKEITDKHLAVGLLAFTCDDNYLLEDYFIKTFTPPFNVRREL